MNTNSELATGTVAVPETPRMDAAVGLKRNDANAPEVWSREDVFEIIRVGRELEVELGRLWETVKALRARIDQEQVRHLTAENAKIAKV